MCIRDRFILGLSLSMEEENAKDPKNFDAESINGVKVSLMGPLDVYKRQDLS